jgi:hypothetical protein
MWLNATSIGLPSVIEDAAKCEDKTLWAESSTSCLFERARGAFD